MTQGRVTEHTLVLLRHGKAATPEGDVADRDRALTVRGQADAAAAGAWLARHGFRPDVVVCSPARRTRQTWQAVESGMAGVPAEGGMTGAPDGSDRAPRVRHEPTVYAADTADLLDLLRAVEPDAGTVLLVGHNPGISLLSIALDRAGADREGLRTSGVVVHRVTGAWADLGTVPAPVIERHTARA
ncbi:SixA phosphatase family protein [Micromonospora sagamiensis]|uniref:Phosphohistidine phosphatase n=1 Tax=Micromonospora sagamiensis TaxID=47875 RepID=A0A562WNX2_9ACTN|nr:histidine phosphatase family protein [Micromonospora sagamiensis]TWJ31989.1 phosphohistidine phosphatase [Micromonospora sagamiensis]BCL14955.1 phosphoglycerate mutase [Micromonospora sagamiensis]